MKKISFTLLASVFALSFVQAQLIKKDSTLQISGSADIYYKYDFAEGKNIQSPENVVLGTKQNSIDFGMLDLRIKKDIGKTSIFSELAFGARPSFNLVDPQLAYNIQNIYVTYRAKDNLSFSAGLMYRYQTYERMTPADNFNYAMSYTFLNHYFLRSAGIRGTYSLLNDKIKIVAGLYNSYDPKSASNPTVADYHYGLSDFSGQVFVKPIKDLELSGALWKEGRKENGNHWNFQAKYQVTKKTRLGMDLTSYKCTDSITAFHSFTGVTGYVQHEVCKHFIIGGRYEYMQKIEPDYSGPTTVYPKRYYNIYTLTSCIKLGALSFKQEFKLDQTTKSNTNTLFLDKNSNPSDNGKQIVLAAVYTF